MLNIKNNSKTTLVSSISETATQMTVANASLLPDAPCRVSIDNEILEITAKEGNVCTIERGKEETTPATHAQNSEVKANVTAGIIEDLNCSFFTYGETIAVNDALYLKASDGKVYKTDANYNDERIYNFVGFAKKAGNANDVKPVQVSGIVDGFSGLTTGAYYYLSWTSGEISTTPGTYPAIVGKAISTTKIFLMSWLRDIIFDNEYKIASEDLKNSNDDERSHLGTVVTKLKEIKLNAPLENCRVKFEGIWSGQSAPYARVYKNGSPLGQIRALSGQWAWYSEDFSNFAKNDLIQLYVWGTGSDTYIRVRNFRLYYRTAAKVKQILPYEKLESDDIIVSRVGEAISTTNQDP